MRGAWLASLHALGQALLMLDELTLDSARRRSPANARLTTTQTIPKAANAGSAAFGGQAELLLAGVIRSG